MSAHTGDLETFSYSASHDLRAPLRALDGLSNALLEDCGHSLSEVGLGYTKRIRAAAAQMTSLIEDLLNLARVPRAEIHPQELDLGGEVARIAEELQDHGPDRHVRFIIQQQVWARADVTLIRTSVKQIVNGTGAASGLRAHPVPERLSTSHFPRNEPCQPNRLAGTRPVTNR